MKDLPGQLLFEFMQQSVPMNTVQPPEPIICMHANSEAKMNIILQILQALSNLLTPEFRKFLGKMIADWEVAAKKTPNQFDDLLVSAVKALAGL